jgi:hypothetical protein
VVQISAAGTVGDVGRSGKRSRGAYIMGAGAAWQEADMIGGDTIQGDAIQPREVQAGSPSGAVRKGWAALAAIGQVLSALDDRNLPAALRVLEPERAEEKGRACRRCVTHGE